MILLSAQSLTKHFGPDPVLSGVTFDLHSGQRVGLVGPNGTGKSTLLKILAGRETADAGDVDVHATVRIGYLQQHADFIAGRTVWDEAREAMRDLIALAKRSEDVAFAISATNDPRERNRLETEFDQLQHELHQREGYTLDHKLERVLEGLGFNRDTFSQDATHLSGGQQNRLLLAKLLLTEPEILLLDEPNNHLDIAATEWLEEYLVKSSQAMLVVSHDRYFLDKVTEHTLELFHGTTDRYKGNFSAYWRLKLERLEVQRRTYDKQQTEISKMEDFVRRHHAGQKHQQAEDRRKKLERIERVEPPREIIAPTMAFPKATRTGDIVLRVEHVSKQYADWLFRDVQFDLQRGERWGVLGPNGSGKTTLLRCLLGEVKPDEGNIIWGTGVQVGYFDQLLQQLDDKTPVVDAIRPTHKEFVEQERRDLLARFGLTGDLAFQTVESLSGGERNRAALAQLAATDANVLVLDEPTNHLDLWARDALESTLREFAGTVLFVSHDRYFLNRVADHVLVLEPGRVSIIDGNYDAYLYRIRQRDLDTSVIQHDTKTQSGNASTRRAREKPPRQKRKFPYRKLEELEMEILEHEMRIEQIHSELVSPEVLRDGQQVKVRQAELQQLQEELAQLYEHWEEAVELN